jgi:hypothetical protein
MSHSHNHNKVPYCLNCHHPMGDDNKFCPNCGQENRDSHITLHDLWHEVTHYFTHVDNKIFVTIRDLLIPGKLTEEFFRGHRKRYVPPITLFFVLGIILPYVFSQMFKPDKTNDLNKGIRSPKEVYRKDLLAEADSIVKHDSLKYSVETRRAFDTVLIGLYQKTMSLMSKEDTSARGIQIQFYINKERLEDLKQATDVLSVAMPLDNATTPQAIAIQKSLSDYQKALKKAEMDSIAHVAAFARLSETTTEDALSRLKMGYTGFVLGRSMFKSLKRTRVDMKIDSLLKTDPNYNAETAYLDSISKVIRRDSSRAANIKVSQIDLIEMDLEAVYKKYGITDWKTKTAVKLISKLDKGGTVAFLKILSEKSTLMNALNILPLAGLMFWLYRRSNRYFVEHVIFQIHYTTFGFIITPLMLFKSMWAYGAVSLINCIWFIFALHRVYQQSWGKTILKGIFVYLVGMVIGTFLSFAIVAISAIL